MSAVWTWVLGGTPPAGVERRQLTQATARTLTRRVDGAATAQFTLDGRSSEAAEIVALATDLHIYRDGVKLFRGRITAESDSIDDTTHQTQFTAVDYRGMLAYRQIGADGRIFTAVDQAEIAWTLIAESQALAGGNWGISNGLGATSGQLRDRTYDAGKPIGQALDELGRVDNGFEWDIDPTLTLRRWYVKRGIVSNRTLDYGGKLTRVERLLAPNDFANSVLVSGDSGLIPVTEATSDIATDERGRWETSIGSTVVEQTTLVTKAAWLIAQTRVVRPDISIVFAPERWSGDDDVSLGDVVKLIVNSGRLTINASHRVVEIVCTPGDDGTETIAMGLIGFDIVYARWGVSHWNGWEAWS